MDKRPLSALTAKTVTIQIAPEDLAQLKQAGCQLCAALQVDGGYDVVWQAASQYVASNRFQWMPQFQIFATNIFRDGVTVRAASNLVNIGLGQQSTLSQYGLLGPAVTSGPASSVNFLNQYGPIHPALNRFGNWIDGTDGFSPIYVRQQPLVMGTSAMTPLDKVLVWFEQDIETALMFDTPRPQAIEIDLTHADSATRLYKNRQWSIPPGAT